MLDVAQRPPMYDPAAVQPMRDELTWVGIEELTTPQQVEDAVANTKGSLFVIVNSVCGCAAGGARPAATAALQHTVIPNRSVSVFAGQDRDAVDAMRAKFGNNPPSSPSMALFVDGELKYFLPRHGIEGRTAEQIAAELMQQFENHAKNQGPSVSKEKYDQLVHARMCGSKIPRLGEDG